MTYIEDLVQSIDRQIDEVKNAVASLEAARSKLVNGSAPPPTRKPRRQSRRRRAAKPKPTEVVPAGALSRILAENPGLTTSALAQLANADRDQVLTLLKEMESAGDARRTGVRAGTRWFAITDEDRIQARAAELARRSKRAPTTKGPPAKRA
ncbi:MAG TPA: hypothetical protein VGH93_13655 [Solirubrobacteraceae bacterium]